MGLDLTGLGGVADFAKTVVNKVFPDKLSDGERAQAELAIQELAARREAVLTESKREVITAELAQDDNYTKRARPTVVYSGLLFIFIVHVAFPCLSYYTGKGTPTLDLPQEFWWAWGGICSAWVLGRSTEKAATAKGKSAGGLVSMITGGNRP